MDGRGRCFDNIFIERLWRSLKYEEIYLHDYGWCPRRGQGSETGSGSTTKSGRIRAWATGRRRVVPGMRTWNQRKEAWLNLGALPPNPRGLTLWGQNVWITINALERRIGQRRGATRAPAQAPEWQGRLRLPHRNQDPPIYNLSSPNFGLDNGVHFSEFRENLEWAVVVPGDGEMSPAVTRLLEELSARGITIHDSQFGTW
jgi:hypothetical protein